MAGRASKPKGVMRRGRNGERRSGPRRIAETLAKSEKGASESDWNLVERFKKGDPEAFDRIFQEYSGPLLGFLTRMCGNAEDAEEGLQDTLLAVFRYLDGFRGEASLKNWIFRIAVSACLKKKRKMRPLQKTETGAGETTRAGGQGFAYPPEESIGTSTWASDPERLLLDEEFRRVLVQAVASMPPIYKMVMNLRDFEGFSTQEVSEMLGITEAAVKVRLHRARLMLQEAVRRRFGMRKHEGKGERSA
jgi:RNA polymerase sigma-70 factor (ECF subfamily)